MVPAQFVGHSPDSSRAASAHTVDVSSMRVCLRGWFHRHGLIRGWCWRKRAEFVPCRLLRFRGGR
eukprot:12932815-Prorocentrum_lima.AAC.1